MDFDDSPGIELPWRRSELSECSCYQYVGKEFILAYSKLWFYIKKLQSHVNRPSVKPTYYHILSYYHRDVSHMIKYQNFVKPMNSLVVHLVMLLLTVHPNSKLHIITIDMIRCGIL